MLRSIVSFGILLDFAFAMISFSLLFKQDADELMMIALDAGPYDEIVNNL